MAAKTFDAVVVGGGVIGLSTALHLAVLGGRRVAVLERHGIAAGQSGRAAGIVRALVRNGDVAGWLLESLAFFKGLSARFGVSVDVNHTGYLLVSRPQERPQVEACLQVAAAAGCEATLIDGPQARELQPGLPRDVDRLYAYEPGAVHIDPMAATHALGRLVVALGVEIHEGCEVTDVAVERGSVTGVETAAGRIHAGAVMVATAAWGRAQLLRLGIDVPVHPHRAEMAFFHVPAGSDHRLVRVLSDTTSMLYMRPEGARQMFVGWREGDRIRGLEGLVEEDPDHYRQTSHYASLVAMEDGLSGLLPFMRDGFVHRTYACVYDYTPDAMPILDRAAGLEGLYFALGYSGGGFSIAPWVGRSMADWIHTGRRPPRLELLGLDRFATGRLIDWSNVKPRDEAA